MPDYSDLTKRLVEDAIYNKLPGLTKEVTFHYFVSDGEYDAETDTTTPVYEDSPAVKAVGAKPTFADVKERDALFSDIKLIVPGTKLAREPQVEVDRVTIDGDLWNVRKCVGVPGGAVFLIFCNRL